MKFVVTELPLTSNSCPFHGTSSSKYECRIDDSSCIRRPEYVHGRRCIRCEHLILLKDALKLELNTDSGTPEYLKDSTRYNKSY